MAELIHEDSHDWDLGPRWTVERQPHATTDPSLVRFVKRSQSRCLLDQIARWNGRGWDPSRWVPAYPGVPRTLLTIVERHMKQQTIPISPSPNP